MLSAVLIRFGQNVLFCLLTSNLILFALKTVWPGEELHAREYVPLAAVVSVVIYYLLAIVYKEPRR